MATREQVLALMERGISYEEAAAQLGLDPGLAYLIATGLPADGGDAPSYQERERPGVPPQSTQVLANPPQALRPNKNPTQGAPASKNYQVLDWIKQRVEADGQMQSAATSREVKTAGGQDVAEDDIATVLTRTHDQLTAMLEQLAAIPGAKKGGSSAQIAQRESIVGAVTVAFSQHAASEQEYFWPAVRKALPDGDHLAEQALQQEREGNDTLAALGRAAPDSEEYDDLVEALTTQARKHVSFEDQVLLALSSALDLEQRRSLGAQLRRAQRAAPARQRRRAPNKSAPAVKAAGARTAASDKARSSAGRRPAGRRDNAVGEATTQDGQAETGRGE
ncbi:MAG: hemerythrin domain-containing protein [Mycobacteriales bacterium]